ncbi:hypothetical protein SAMN06265337_3596 [Hymenobacter gelipurpurascens]|uniref:Outer membrane protein beta-barrel domain-containing protein n=1 Tax=Hymenobacter gelipurpurascens TaxID=89968 RepID=A0A212UF23_9BACT|nr:hypothetical protein [Hymenobacter gelipurpurascens]SNC76855.1 hypothetical protein SAMN06265337_3596 [Hymenobacter gelipurpurascens]
MTSSFWLRTVAVAGWATLVASSVCAQSTAPASGRFSLQAHYGINGNFFTSSQVTEFSGEYIRTNFLGTAGGGQVAYHLTPSSSVALEYTRSVNSKPVHFTQYIGPYGYAQESDLRIRYINNAFQAVYERQFSPQSNWKYHAGLLYMTTASQTLTTGRYLSVSEINRRNSYSEEAGVVAGLEYSRPIDTHFRLGLRARGYYLISVTTLEMVTLTPTLTYRF